MPGRGDPFVGGEQQLRKAERGTSIAAEGVNLSFTLLINPFGYPDCRERAREGNDYQLDRILQRRPPRCHPRRRRHPQASVHPSKPLSLLTSAQWLILDHRTSVWDVKAFKKPIAVATDLPSLNPETNLVFSPDDQLIVTGTAGSKAGILAGGSEEALAKGLAEKGITGGKLVVLNREGLTVAHKIDVSEASVVKVLWHPRINQVSH